MPCDKVFGVIFCLVAVTLAHVRVNYNPDAGLTVRDATSPTGNGLFSVDNNGCGGETTFGDNGVNNITAGTTVTLLFNYGTGTSGDHPSENNVFRVAAVPLQNTHEETFDLMLDEENWLAEVPAPAGSRPSGYEATITIPSSCMGNCVLGIHDQRNWGGCHDLSVSEPSADGAGSVLVSVFLLATSLALFFF